MRNFSYVIITVLIAACISIAQNAPRELTAFSNLDGRVELSWLSPIIDVETVELAYDDGSGGGLDEGDRNDIVSVRFTPAEDCSLISTRFWGYCPYPELYVQVSVYEDNGVGRPDVYSPLYTVEHILVSGWQTIDLSESGLTFDAGEEFHIGVKKIMSPDTFPHYILHDNDPCGESRSWLFDYSYFSFVEVPGDLQIRASVYYGARLATLSPHSKRVIPFGEPVYMRRSFIPADVEYYKVYRGSYPDTSLLEFLDYTTDTFYNDVSVTNDNVYYYSVKAQHSGLGISPFSNMVSATPRSTDASIYIDTMIYDDGVPNATAFYSGGNGFGTCLPINQVGQLKTLLYRFNVTGEFKPQIWSVDADSFPSQLILSSASWLPVSAPGWRNVNVSSWETIIVDGPFVASCIVPDFYTGIAVDVPGFAQSFDYGGGDWSAIADTTYMIRAILEYYDDVAYYNIKTGWNLVSVPVFFEDNSVSNIFPTAMYGIAYEWRFSTEYEEWYYDTTSVVEPGDGYWILSDIDTMYMISGGIPARTLDVPMHPEWNLIGGISNPEGVGIYSLTSYPEEILGDHIYIYTYNSQSDEMQPVDKILPGKGYFILSYDSGVLNLR
ncbi:hypothetical protein DRQ33_04910 [bacterium]|nr:MAG: hypothetical protein DRQ33_04910 [bacterium]